MSDPCFPLRRAYLLLLYWVSPSYLMHQLGEHNCHSEYNVHRPKKKYCVEYDYNIACSKMICMESLLELWRCPRIYVFLFLEGQARYHFTMLLLWSNKHITFNASLLIVNYLCYFSCCNLVAKFTFDSNNMYHAFVKLLRSQLTMLLHNDWSSLCWLHVTSIFLSLTYSKTSRS